MLNIIIIFIGFLGLTVSALAEVKVLEKENYTFSIYPYVRTDVVTLGNTVDLDDSNSGDSTTYIGFDYSLGLDLKFKDNGPQMYLKLERNGPYDYDAPLFIHDTLMTSVANVENYEDAELLPQLEEFWTDLPLYNSGLRLKTGLFTYNVGHGISLNGSYENYGISLYSENETLKWHIYYCKSDLVNKNYLGPRIEQEQEQGIDYEDNKSNFFAADTSFVLGNNTIGPYLGILSDRTDNDWRSNLFSTPTDEDLLGTLGLSWDIAIGKLSLGLEGAKNFGEAKSSDSSYGDVQHTGYIIYADSIYDLDRFKPHSRFILSSGNKVTTEMIDNGEILFTNSKNKAFSVFSPLNVNLADSIYPSVETVPLVAMGGGWGLNYGIDRPTTFSDARLLENLIMPNLGFEYQLTDKFSLTFDWWNLMAKEKGVGTYNGVSKELSPYLGNEVDLFFYYTLNDNVTLSLLSGYFFPGKYYKEKRDDIDGSLFTPFIRGDGDADGAYQIELNIEVKF